MPRRPSRYVLRALMRHYELKAPDVARLCSYQPQTVRAWLCGARPIPGVAYRRVLKKYPFDLS